MTRGQTVQRGSGRTLLDYFTFANLYQPCPVLAVPDAPFRDAITFAANRCASFREKGLLTADAVEGQARESLERMRDYGWDQEIGILHAFGYYVAPDATATKYVNDHGRFEVRDRLCGYSYDASFNAVKRFGHVVSCLGWGTHALAPLSFRAATYSGVFTLLPMLTGQGRAHHGEILREAAKLAEAGKVAPILDPHRFQLAQVADAHAAIENRIAAGKIVVDIEF